ncbi:MAG TPA: TerC family protein [Dongiaceae bacterium]|nr:TerC family protein [Dongiaceae bacterium]
MFEWIADPSAWVALATLTALEIVLGIDNIIFISILVGRLPEHQRQKARVMGLGLAMFTRIALLMSLAWVMSLTEPLFTVDFLERGFSGRDFILFGGGFFLLWKSTVEIFSALEGEEEAQKQAGKANAFFIILIQIAIIDIVFSLDSVITAVGLSQHVPIMVIAIMIAVFMMMFAAKTIGDFVDRHPSLKMLALSFLILVGFTLMAEGFGVHIPKPYIYVAMGFSLAVEAINIRMRSKRGQAVKLHNQMPDDA